MSRLLIVLVAVSAAFSAIAGAAQALADATWASRQVEVGVSEADSLFGVSCPSAALCVAVGSRGTIVTSRNPEGGAGAWSSETATPGPFVGMAPGQPDRTSPGTFRSVSCPTTQMCAAVTYAGDLYVSAEPAGGASSWRATDLDGTGLDTHLTSVSCPNVTLCVAVAAGATNRAEGGKVIAIHDPLLGSTRALEVQLDPSLNFQGVSCTGPAFCIAVSNKGRIVVSRDPGNSAPSWDEIGAPGGPGDLGAVECPNSSTCLVGNAGGNVLASIDANAGTLHWREVNAGASVPITAISCPTVSRCVAVDNNGDVAVSTNPTDSSASWSARNLMPFTAGDGGLPLNAFFGVSCPSINLCAAVGSGGRIFTSDDPFAAAPTGRGKGPRGPRRPRLQILRSDNFVRQSRTKGIGSRVTFRLRSYGWARGFVCSLDRRRFRRCASPLRIYAKVGHHVLRARAIGATGLKGPMAKERFAIRRPDGRRTASGF